jgi:hypothetical protein
MSNSGSEGRAGGFSNPFTEAFYSSRPLFEGDFTAAELYELERLIAKYPTEARRFLDSPDGSGSPP